MQIHNAILTGSTTVYGPINILSGSLTGTSSYAATSSYSTAFTVGGTLTAQTLVVQTITASIEYSSGSNIFGSQLTDRQTFTGSMYVTGSTHSIFGNFGIGNTSPVAFLTVDGNATSSRIVLERDTVAANTVVGYIDFANSNATNTYGRVLGGRNAAGDGYVALGTGISTNLYALESGNVGIGLSNPSALLHISGSGSGSLFRVSSHLSSSIFFISGSGNVGIGMADPTVKLDVSGSITDANGGIIKIRSGASDASIRIGVTSSYSWIQAHGSKPLYINELGNNVILNLGGGSVGIGTSNPGGTLEVANLSAGVTVGDFLVNTTSKYVYVGRQSSTSGDNTTFVVRDRTGTARATIPGGGSLDTVFSTNNSNFNVTNYGGTSFFFISGSGNIGIGTSTPSGSFTVQSSGAQGILLETDTSNSGVSTRIFGKYSGGQGSMRYDNRGWLFNTNAGINSTSGTERFAITPEGYVRLMTGTTGIQFQGNTASTSALNYYEEGTWTPVFGGAGSPSYTTQVGKYTRVGRIVYCTIALRATSVSSASTISISGLPFSPADASDTAQRSTYSPRLGGHINGVTETTAKFRVTGGTSLDGVKGDGTTTYMTATEFTSGGSVQITGDFWYYV